MLTGSLAHTHTQAEAITYLYDELNALTARNASLQKPRFSVVVLYCSEPESIKRQLHRGREIARANAIAAESGIGVTHTVRTTDMSEDAARHRYRVFKDEVFSALQSVKDHFPFRFIPADGPEQDVKRSWGTSRAWTLGPMRLSSSAPWRTPP